LGKTGEEVIGTPPKYNRLVFGFHSSKQILSKSVHNLLTCTAQC